MNNVNDPKPDLYQQLRPVLPFVEAGFWPISIAINTFFNIVVVQMDIARSHQNFLTWEPVTWEVSSSVLALILLPVTIYFTRRVPLRLANWRWVTIYLIASGVWSICHVVGMVLIRKLVYTHFGKSYDFGEWPREFFYEYLKDFRSFVLMVSIIEGYRFFVRRLQGEARLLDADDDISPSPPASIPDRFLVKKLGREFLVAAAEIEYAQAAGNYVNLHVHGRDYPLRSTIADLDSKLDQSRFVRVHRSYIVNIEVVVSIESLEAGDAKLHLRDKAIIPCSRTYRNNLKSLIQ